MEDFTASMSFKDSLKELYQFWQFSFPEKVVKLIPSA